MSQDHSLIEPEQFADVRRRVVIFSILGLFIVVVLLAIFQPEGAAAHAGSATRRLVVTTPSGEIIWAMVPALVLMGFGAGFLAGMLGMGGGVLKISGMLLFFRMDIFFARAISLVTMFFSSASALRHYLKQELVIWEIARPMVLFAGLAALLGGIIGSQLPAASLTHAFGLFVFFFSFSTLALVFSDPNEGLMRSDDASGGDRVSGGAAATVGLLHGGLCGLLGISGGVVATPLQQVILRMPLRNAIAQTLLASTVATGVASLTVLWTGLGRGSFLLSQVLYVDLFMGSGATLGGMLGARLAGQCNVTVLRLAFVCLTLVAGVSIVF